MHLVVVYNVRSTLVPIPRAKYSRHCSMRSNQIIGTSVIKEVLQSSVHFPILDVTLSFRPAAS